MLRKLNVVLMLLVSVIFSQSYGQKETDKSYTGMLILGSADPNTNELRAEVGFELYKSDINFDYIIVSGGCGAHESSICEASDMADILKESGVPPNKIFKEEKSKSTVQNYCYSRILRRADGTKVIKPGDNLYVVSNHWHAIPVAARFSTFDEVNARYHIEGNILPTEKDKVDYTNIFNNKRLGDDFCNNALWPRVTASLFLGRKNGPVLFYEEKTDGDQLPVISKKIISNLNVDWQDDIDASFYEEKENRIYFFKGNKVLKYNPDSHKVDAGFPLLIVEWMNKRPENWKNSFIDAAYYHSVRKRIYLFNGDYYIEGKIKNGHFTVLESKPVKHIQNWPFEWGSGDLDAAYFDSEQRNLYFFRGTEFLEISSNNKTPKRTTVFMDKSE